MTTPATCRRSQAARDSTPADFGTPVSDSLESTGETMIEIARWLRKYEPLSLEALRDYGAPLMAASGVLADRLADMMRANGKW
jgi:hypothetical protein